MSQIQEQIITKITPNPDFSLSIEFDGGYKGVVDFKPLIQQGGVFKTLASPTFFRQVKIGESGRFIVWPGDLEFCADALYADAAKVAALRS
jgi:hypothetical protein